MILSRARVSLALVGCIALAAAASACTETERAQTGILMSDREARITCREYGEIMFDGRSTGKVVYDETGRINFINAATGGLEVLEGECRVSYDNGAGKRIARPYDAPAEGTIVGG